MTTDPNVTAAELPAMRHSYGRRALMLGAAAVGAGAAASLAAPDPAQASNGKPVLLGESNTATAATSVSNADGDGFAGATSRAGHRGIHGNDTSGGGGHGVAGHSVNGTGVTGTSVNGIGVTGTSTHANAIVGASSNGIGVRGSSLNATGVYATGATALAVDGPVQFSTSGIATVTKGTQSVTVSLASAATFSVVLATIQQDRPGITVQSAVATNGSFTITLTGKPAADTPVGWFVINSPNAGCLRRVHLRADRCPQSPVPGPGWQAGPCEAEAGARLNSIRLRARSTATPEPPGRPTGPPR